MANKPPIADSYGTLSKRALKWIVIGSIIALAGLVWLVCVLYPMPPRTITMATGPEGSSYETFGKRYKLLMAKEGINVILVPTKGGVDNLTRLLDPKSKVEVAFVEGGVAEETDETSLLSLGTVAYEPIWLFSHKTANDKGLFDLKGRRVSIGPEGSDSRALVTDIFKRNGMGLNSIEMVGLEPEQTEKALLNDDVDSAILVNSLSSPVVRKLLTTPGIHLANFARADAYVSMFPYLTKLELPEGAISLEKDLPRNNKQLLATKTSLIIRGKVHPALQYLLLEAASQIHSRHGVFQKSGEFPSPETLEIPLSPDARHYFKSGRPFLQRFLPFWLAALAEQFAIFIVPALGLMYPLIKSLTSLYGWGMQRRIFLIYGEVHWVENQLDSLDGKPVPPELLDRMRHLEQRARRLKVAANYIPMVYSLKETLAYVKNRIETLQASKRI